jgi:hypothetical protein
MVARNQQLQTIDASALDPGAVMEGRADPTARLGDDGLAFIKLHHLKQPATADRA